MFGPSWFRASIMVADCSRGGARVPVAPRVGDTEEREAVEVKDPDGLS